MKYKISSRATILLGRESVSKVDGALIELIKNTYDADAVLCFVFFDIENDTLYILDNGTGMTKSIIQDCWMLIGTDNKREQYKSNRNRIKSGEKGIGRFALDRLGSRCEMYTKSQSENKLILWKTNWENFEQRGKTLDEIEADFEYQDVTFESIIPSIIRQDIADIISKKYVKEDINLSTGTLLKITGLRDKWTETEIDKIIYAMGFLLPPVEQKDYIICVKENETSPYQLIDNEITEEYDYRLISRFDGTTFHITLFRNEFDLTNIPDEVFGLEDFKEYPYRKCDFEKDSLDFEYSIEELLKSSDLDLIATVKEIGPFKFNYTFMKLLLNDDSKETFYYKPISSKRTLWLSQHGGIKIYRDNFLVRPYGDPSTDSFDWLGLDARRAKNPEGIANPRGNWHVRNKQGQGSVLISRINNGCILDKSSREGIIENKYFSVFKMVLTNIMSVFEQDRAHIGKGMKSYEDIVDQRENTKQEGSEIARKVLSQGGRTNDNNQSGASKEQVKTLAKAVKFYEEEREELISEIKLLRSLATNGLITTSIAHDLKSLNGILVNRVDGFEAAIRMKNDNLIARSLNDLRRNDIFLKSWISTISNQMKKDKRKRIKKDICQTIEEIVDVLQPILIQKKIVLGFSGGKTQVQKRIFISDFESITYNLIINSIEAFEKSKISERRINIAFEHNENFMIHYSDNGCGISKTFKNPYDIFKFGTTSKYDKDGNIAGTGLGMYIVASTLREYNAQYKIVNSNEPGFSLDMEFPL
ncbi:MAG: ATP-binding protein [Intestinimonas sp.]|jgi:signal transduction histidine kinase|nr:ATP-binding protein [Intestinimonas sp.]